MTLTKLPEKIAGMAVMYTPHEKAALLERVGKIADSGFFLWGDQQEEFQARFAELTHRTYGLVFSSTTSALEFVLRFLAEQKGRALNVAVQANAFPSVVFAARRAGCAVAFADVDVLEGAPSIVDWKAQVHRDGFPDVIVHQHTGGSIHPSWPAIVTWARSHGIFVIEDSSQAAGSFNAGVIGGQLGDVAFFSTSATKALHTGQGSVMVTDDEVIARHMTRIRQYGRTQMFQAGEFVVEGGNISQSEMNAAVGNVMLDTLYERIRYRERLAEIYKAGLDDLLVFAGNGGKPNWYKQPALLPEGIDRTTLKTKLLEEGNVQLGSEVYDFLTPRLAVFEGAYAEYELPNAATWSQRHVCMPLHNVLRASQAEDAAKLIRTAILELQLPVPAGV